MKGREKKKSTSKAVRKLYLPFVKEELLKLPDLDVREGVVDYS